MRRFPITPVLAVFAFLASAPFAAQAATPCKDCCQLPCVEAEIRYAMKMQEWYRSQMGIKNLTPEKYEAAEKAKAAELSKERAKDAGVLPACNWNLPDPRKDPIAMKPWNLVKWSVKEDAQGNLVYDFSMKTNPKTCELREDQISLYHEIVPCAGIADAAEKHERAHVEQCVPRKGRAPTMTEIVQGEVDAYGVELTELNNLRQALEKVCSKGTCTTKHEGGDVKKRLEEELETLRQQLAKRGGRK